MASLMFPEEMMHDSVWLNRLEYYEAEVACQIEINAKYKVLSDGEVKKKVVNIRNESSEDEPESDSSNENSIDCRSKHDPININFKDFVSTSDFLLLRDAVINLTQAVSTLSIQNDNLKKENTKLKNRMENAEVRITNFVKTHNDVPIRVEKLTSRVKNAEQAVENVKKSIKNQPRSNQMDSIKVQLEAAFTQGLKQLHQQTADAITTLQSSQQNDKYSYEEQLKSVKQYLLDKDLETKEKLKEMKLDILSIMERKNQVIEQAIQNVVKDQTYKRGSFEYYSEEDDVNRNETKKGKGQTAKGVLTNKAPPNLKLKNRGNNDNSSDLSSWLEFNKEQNTQYSNSVKGDNKQVLSNSSNSQKGSSLLSKDTKGPETSFFGLGTNPSAAAPYCDVKINDPVVSNWFQWKLPKRNPTDTEIIHHSVTFLTGTPGYRAQLRAKIDRLHGDIYFSARILQGMFDEYLQWPFPLKFTIRVTKTNEKNDDHTWLIPKGDKWKASLGKPSIRKEKVYSEWVGPFNLSGYLMRRQIPLEFVPCT